MKHAIWIFILFSLAGCRGDIVDVSQLSLVHRFLFAEAAAREDISVTTHGQPWNSWSIGYDYNIKATGLTKVGALSCHIWINPNKLSVCKLGGINQYFIIVSQHELRHCKNIEHSSNPKNLMYESPLCWPEI